MKFSPKNIRRPSQITSNNSIFPHPTINNGLGLGFVSGKTYVSDYDGNEYVWKQLFNVQFVDDDGTVLKEEVVKFGDAASAPDLPERIGYTSNWSVSWQDIQGDTVITVVYELDEPVIEGISTDAVDDTVTYGINHSPFPTHLAA